jgi:hypothetical protein
VSACDSIVNARTMQIVATHHAPCRPASSVGESIERLIVETEN